MLEVLARLSIDGALLVALVWTLNRVIPALSPRARAAVWWCAAAKFAIGLVWTTPVLLPVLPPSAASMTERALVSTPADPIAPREAQAPTAPRPSATPSDSEQPNLSWTFLLGTAWLCGLVLSTALGAREWLKIRAAIGGSIPPPASVLQAADEIAAVLGLRVVPLVRMSEDVASPVVVGLLRPVVLLPAGCFARMPADQQRMSLCHEMAHVKRGDLWLGFVPALAERLFFFHPFARLAAREYAFWREAACDAAVISALGTAPQSYGRLLLDLGVTSRRAALAPAGAAWSFRNLRRRIVMLRRPESPSLQVRLFTTAAVVGAVAGLVPLQLTARPDAATEAMVPAAVRSTMPASPLVPQEKEDRESLRYVLFIGDDHTTMSGRSGDIGRARRHRRPGEPMLWFLRGGTEYVVRDPDILAALQAIWEPVGQIGGEQGQVGAKQGEIGAKQGEIGARQGTIGAEQGIIGAKQGEIGVRQAALSARGLRQGRADERDEIERERRALDDEMRKLDAEMRRLDAQMRALDAPMRDLGQDMEVLGREMEVLGRKMEEASRKAEAEMRALIDKAIRSGAAQRVK
jgi:beta-lactamase regulating signal transducer with metallopeptidase domain